MNPIKLTKTQKKAKDISRNIAVTAGAGSGKTEVLTQRLVHIYEQNRHLGIHNVLVLTFTERAAGEMKNRFREHLTRQLSLPDITDKEKTHWSELKEEFSENHISTIHAFCASILRRYPIEADLDPTFSVLEGFDQQNRLKEAIKTVLHQKARDSEDKHLGVLLDIWRRAHLADILYDLVERRWELREWIERYKTWEPEQLMAEIIEQRDACLSDLLSSKELSNLRQQFASCNPDSPGAKEDSFGKAKKEYIRLLDVLVKSPPLPPEQALEFIRLKRPRKPGKPTKAWSRDGAALKENIDEFKSLLSRYPLEDFNLHLEERGILILKSLAAFLGECLEVYQSKKRESQCLDFEDLQIETANLLTEHPKVRRELARQFRYIMVDEFQDTNDLQWEIVRQLACDDKGKIASDKLFIVGDEKQSIYSFRGADVTTFGRARAELQQRDAQIIFDENFRSCEELIKFNNIFFHQLLSRREGYELYEASPQRLTPGQKMTGGSVELLLINENDDPAISYREEARLIAGRIRQIYDGDLTQYMDITQLLNRNEKAIAILFRRRTHLGIYENALREAGLEFIVPGNQGFFQRQEIKDFSCILDFLIHPGDSIALAGVLRSPLVGLSDDALYSISRSIGDTLWERLQNFTGTKQWDKSECAAYERGMAQLNSWLSMRENLCISELIRTIFDKSGYTVSADPQIRVNVESLISMARKYERIPWNGLWEFTTFLDEQIVTEEKEEGGSIAISEGAIQLMTIHKSKGLEFPLVIIPDLSADFFKGKRASYYWGNTTPDSMQLGIKAPDEDYKSEDTFFRKLLSSQSRKKDLAEYKRIFYVAATRAQSHLILAGQIRTAHPPPKNLDHCKKFMDWLKILLRIESLDSARLSSPEGNITIPITHYIDDELKPPVQVPLKTTIPKISHHLAKVKHDNTPRLSPTALSCYASCPRCFFFRYVLEAPDISALSNDGLNVDGGEKKDDPSLSAAFRGMVAHSLFEDEIYEDKEILRHRVLSRLRQSGRFDIPPSFDTFCQDVYVNLINYRHSDTFTDAADEFYNEVPFEVEVSGVMLFGVIDKLYRSKTDGILRVLDFKTNAVSDLAQAAREVRKHRYDLQVHCYCLAAEEITGKKIKEARLFFSHIPSNEREIIVPFHENTKRNLETHLNSLTSDVQTGQYLAHVSSSCQTCSYNSYCRGQNCKNS